MGEKKQQPPAAELTQIIESAKRLGIELDEAEAMQWLTAMAAMEAQQDVVVDERSGVFGHSMVMLDFSPADLAHFREIGRLVEFEDIPGVVETALALSGSAAQSKIQTYPGDADYFERVNIRAESREKACRILADIMRKKALSAVKGPTYQLIEVKFGQYPFDIVKEGRTLKAGSPVAWGPKDIEAGQIEGFTGISDPYEPPENPEVMINSGTETIEESLALILTKLEELGYVPPTLEEKPYSAAEEAEIESRLAALGYL